MNTLTQPGSGLSSADASKYLKILRVIELVFFNTDSANYLKNARSTYDGTSFLAPFNLL
jgi:hypothetical protein